MRKETDQKCADIDYELDRQFGERRPALSELLRQHLDSCERCSRLYRWMLETPVSTTPEPNVSRLDVWRNIQENLKSSAAPVRALPSSGVLILEFWAVFLLLISTAAMMVGMAGLRQMDLVQMAGMGVILFAGTSFLAWSLVWQMIPGSLQRYSTRVVLPIVAAAFLLGLVSFFPWRAPEAFLSRGWHCLKTGLMLSASAAFVFWLFARRGAVLRLHTMGAILGTCGGFVGVTALQLACNHQDLEHLAVWHGAVLMTSTALGVGVTLALQRAIRPV